MQDNYSFINPLGNHSIILLERDEHLAKAEIVTLSIMFAVMVVGNCLVLLALMGRRIQMTRMYYFLFHLCLSDLVTAFLHVLPQIAWDITYRFRGGYLLCKLVKYVQILGPYLSSYILVITAIDRYQAICFPLTSFSWTPIRGKIMVLVAWIISLLCCIPQLFIFSYQDVQGLSGVKDCWGTFIQPWGEKAYVTWYTISVFFIPFIIITFTYTRICLAVWKNFREENCSSKEEKLYNVETVIVTKSNTSDEVVVRRKTPLSRRHNMKGLSKAKVKTVKITVVVIICYIVCSCPFICVQLWAYWDPQAQYSNIWRGPTVTILMLLASLNSCTNPWIYLFFNQNLIQSLSQVCGFNVKKKSIRQTTDVNHTTHTDDEKHSIRQMADVNHTARIDDEKHSHHSDL
ncbi:vasopressin V1a receptor-like [Centruroides vittatus]|uniref:vasopressin V1a receptor-like n=1 Tax=Centruroides vittatus TaxID=120091 RepID=UPI00350F7F29